MSSTKLDASRVCRGIGIVRGGHGLQYLVNVPPSVGHKVLTSTVESRLGGSSDSAATFPGPLWTYIGDAGCPC